MSTLDDLLQAQPALWRASQLGQHRNQAIRTGYPRLDQELPGGGWPTHTLIELLLKHYGIGELRLLMPALLEQTRKGKQIVLLAPPFTPYAQGFEQFGIKASQLLVIRAHNAADHLWALERVLNSNAFGALLAWLPERTTHARSDQLRRLQAVASQSHALSFLFRPSRAQHQPSPAQLRLHLNAATPSQLRVDILKRRGPVLAQPLLLDLIEAHAWLPRAYRHPEDAPGSPIHHQPTSTTKGTHHDVDRNTHNILREHNISPAHPQ